MGSAKLELHVHTPVPLQLEDVVPMPHPHAEIRKEEVNYFILFVVAASFTCAV